MVTLRTAALTLAISLGGVTSGIPTLAEDRTSFDVSVGYAPPPLPTYYQPPCPGYGYLWTPGYWGWDDYNQDYFWVPGTWVRPPHVGYFWTPAYWAWNEGQFFFNGGYWGPSVGYYGGINYGFGYNGWGYDGGYWRDRDFYYNRRANNFGHEHFDRSDHVYDRPIRQPDHFNRSSFNGGPGAVSARQTDQQLRGADRPRFGPAPDLRASDNRGAPDFAAAPQSGAFRGSGIASANRSRQDFVPQQGYGATQRYPRQTYREPPTQMAQPQRQVNPSFQGPREVPQAQAATPQRQAPPQQGYDGRRDGPRGR